MQVHGQSSVPRDDCSRDPTRSKQLSRVCSFSFQFELFHVVVALTFSVPSSVSLAY